jgi:hypothetical protein
MLMVFQFGTSFFQDVVLNRSVKLIRGDPLFLGHHDVHGQQDGGRSIDGHGSGNFFQRDLVEKGFHVPQRVDGHPYLSHLSLGQRMIGIVADLGRQVKGHGEAGLAVFQEVTVTPVRILSGPEPRILAHGPEAAPVHGGLDAAGVREFSGYVQVSRIIRFRDVRG